MAASGSARPAWRCSQPDARAASGAAAPATGITTDQRQPTRDSCGACRPIPPSAARGTAADQQYVKWDPATKTVTFSSVAGPFDFNGFTNGGGTLTVPPAATT